MKEVVHFNKMRLIPPAVIVRQEQDQLVREKEIPKQDRTPHRIIEDDLHEMLEVPYFEEHYLNAPIPNYGRTNPNSRQATTL